MFVVVNMIKVMIARRLENDMYFIVELESAVYLSDGEGDPSRTLNKKHAKHFNTKIAAQRSISNARLFRLFNDALIIPQMNY